MVLGSHLHELATHITFEDETKRSTLWTGYPVTRDDGTIEGVTIGNVYRRLGIKLSPDHRYRVTVYYENPTADTVAALV